METVVPDAFSAAISASVRLATKPLMPGSSRRSRSSALMFGSSIGDSDFAAKWPLGFVITMTACVGDGANAVSGAMNNRAAKAARFIRSLTSLFVGFGLALIAKDN